VIGLILAAVGGASVIAGGLLLTRGGPGYRIGRTLSVAPELTLEEVAAAAVAKDGRYIRTRGRVASDEEFPDENDRPLVYRRQRLQTGSGSRWTDLDEDRVAVPFGLEAKGAFVAVDVDALGEGLVVVPRVAEGVARDLPPAFAERVPGLAPDTPIRLRIDQLSAVEGATAAGVPSFGPDGQVRLTAGQGRPLIVTPLEPDAAMRVLASERRGAVKLAAALLAGGLACVAIGVVLVIAGL
jgi:hypothetical protein